jgi:Flp pilus assembly protein TadD
MRRFKEAAEAGGRAAQLEPGLAEAHYRQGVACVFLGQRAEAVRSFKRAISLRPDYAEAHSDLGVVYLLLGNKAAALAEQRKVQALNPSLAGELFRAIHRDKILTTVRQQ